MEKVYISHTWQPRLIILFLGWGMDTTPFAGLFKAGYDILALYDYTGYDPEHDFVPVFSEAEHYDEVVVVAWSFGVRIGGDFLRKARKTLPVTRALAINGTEQHIHNESGIPEAVFQGTLANLTESSVRKFHRRMFADSRSFTEFAAHVPNRDFQSLHSELETFGLIRPLQFDTTVSVWDRAITGGCDAIFPPAAQNAAWRNIPNDSYPEMPHFPVMQQILDRYIVDKELVAERFAEAQSTYRDNAAPQEAVAQRLWSLAHRHLPTFPTGKPAEVLEIGVGSGVFTDLYIPEFRTHHITLWDIARIDTTSIPHGCTFQCCDAETEITRLHACSVDVLLSASTMQWFNSPAAFIRQTARVLSPGGIAAIALYGSQTCREISALTGEALKYPSLSQLTEAGITSGLEVITAEDASLIYTFPTIHELLSHIKHTGVNAIRRSSIQTNRSALKFIRHCHASQGQQLQLTYNPLYLILRKPDNLQNNG